jgi:hypothetical protein
VKVHVNIDVEPTGLLELEKWQLSFGDIKADASVYGIYNHPGDGGTVGGEPVNVLLDGTLTYTPGLGPSNNPIDPNQQGNLAVTDPDGNPISGVTVTGVQGNIDNAQHEEDLTIALTIDPSLFDFVVTPRDAIDLPQVVNAATAVANNQAIDSTVSVQLHDLQIAAGDLGYDPYSGWGGDGDWYGNSSQELAALVILGAIAGVVDEAHIRADAHVGYILNASVDNAATAVGNNLTVVMHNMVAVDPDNGGWNWWNDDPADPIAQDGVFIGDVVQLLIGDVHADASVSHVWINDYTNFGGAGFGNLSDPQTPIVSNVATAVGNNFTIKLDNCVVCTTVP